MAAEAVKVVVRCRPFNQREQNLKCKNVVEIVSDTGQCSICHPIEIRAPAKAFFFDGAYDCNATTERIYNDIGYPLVEGVTEGYNGTIFAYGQTGCGKSFTMQGVDDDSAQRGIIPRSFDHIFETISVSSDSKFLVYASFLEIYNEEIRDLLARDTKNKLELKEHPEKGVFVAGLSMHQVSNVHDCQVIMNMGWKNRSTGATLMNADSSRSHSIFTINLEMVSEETEKLKAGKLNLVDLAGSERQSKTGATGDRLREATKINLSLSALGNVISALVDSKAKHIPYRDSKLTRLLQDSLGGNTKTLMIACISPADNNYDETLSTLRYANRAKNIQNKPKINEDPKDALLRQYQEEINRLRQLLESQQQQAIPSLLDTDIAEKQKFTEEKEQLRLEYESRLREKEIQCYAEMADKAKLLQEIQKLKETKENGQRTGEKSSRHLEENSRPHGKLTESIGVSANLGTPPSINESRAVGHKAESRPVGDVIIMDTEGHVHSQELDPTYNWKSGAPRVSELHGISTSVSGQLKNPPIDTGNKDDLLRRLALLESGIVGGELANNTEVRARRSRRQKYAEERRRQLEQANSLLEDEGIMVEIYETIQDELEHKRKLLQKEKQKRLLLQSEIHDLQSEFEQDRSDYLDTIRRQQRQLDLMQAIIDRIQPCIRRDSNYHNVDKIKRQARYDEEKNEWILPPLTVERTQLPAPLAELPLPPRQGHPSSDVIDGSRQIAHTRDMEREHEEEARFYAKLASRTQSQPTYFANRRANQLLIDAAALNSNNKRLNNSNHSTTHHNAFPLDVNPVQHGSILPGTTDEVFNKRYNRNGMQRSPNAHNRPK